MNNEAVGFKNANGFIICIAEQLCRVKRTIDERLKHVHMRVAEVLSALSTHMREKNHFGFHVAAYIESNVQRFGNSFCAAPSLQFVRQPTAVGDDKAMILVRCEYVWK